MSAANDNGARVRDLALPAIGMRALVTPGWQASDFKVAGVHHAGRVTLRTLPASSGKCVGSTGSNLRAAPADINAVAGALAAMLAELPVRGGIVDRLA